ncbi:hypothetical protein GCM10011588_37970 [Nocardia jinanensis]|uniref:Resolvase/invertase-type recombinase catalytic domain-containing protein n=1 Tax=Nocardia jinanensis TaxID=382504 RepID=A0A917RR53_9NOCA|nr:hypothetical protein GCM10011588_37970 [Nocardia jinanensis]
MTGCGIATPSDNAQTRSGLRVTAQVDRNRRLFEKRVVKSVCSTTDVQSRVTDTDALEALSLDGDALDPIGGGRALIGYARVSTRDQNLEEVAPGVTADSDLSVR